MYLCIIDVGHVRSTGCYTMLHLVGTDANRPPPPSPSPNFKDFCLGRQAGGHGAAPDGRESQISPPIPSPICRISVMGGEQAATVLHLVEKEKREREGRGWPEEEQAEFVRKIQER